MQVVFGFALLAELMVSYAALQSIYDERRYELALLRAGCPQLATARRTAERSSSAPERYGGRRWRACAGIRVGVSFCFPVSVFCDC